MVIDDACWHLFATCVPDEFDFTRFTRRAQNANIELVGNDAAALGIRPALARFRNCTS